MRGGDINRPHFERFAGLIGKKGGDIYGLEERGVTFEGVGGGVLFAPPPATLQHTVDGGQQLRFFFCKGGRGR